MRSSGRVAGGSPSSSICVTEAAPSRCELPTQSAPVSPPPITITCLPAAVIGEAPSPSPATQRLRPSRYSIAKCTPSSSRPGTGRSRGTREPVAITTASWRVAQLVGADVDADVDAVLEAHALGGELVEAPLDDPLLDLEVRHAEAHEPAAGLVALVDA